MTRRSRSPEAGTDLFAELSAGGAAPRASAREAVSLVRCLPVLVPLAMFAQVALLGLRPALAESARLSAEEERMVDRYDLAKQQALELDRVLRAQRDPIYLERERRLLLAANSPLSGR